MVAGAVVPKVVDQVGVSRLDPAVDDGHNDARRKGIDQRPGAQPRRLGADLRERPLISIEWIVDHRRVYLRAVEYAVLFGGGSHADAFHVTAYRLDVLARPQHEQLGAQLLDRLEMFGLDTRGVQGVHQGLAGGDGG